MPFEGWTVSGTGRAFVELLCWPCSAVIVGHPAQSALDGPGEGSTYLDQVIEEPFRGPGGLPGPLYLLSQ